MSVVFALPLTLALLFQSGSCGNRHKQNSADQNRASVAATPASAEKAGNNTVNQNNRTESVRNDAAGSVPLGAWGGNHIRLQVNANGADVEYDCGHGTISGKLLTDARGNFTASGTHVQERGGPVRADEQTNSRPARYTGRIDGKTMTLRVVLTDSDETLGSFALTHGQEAKLFKCY